MEEEYFVVAHVGPNVKGQDVGKIMPMHCLYHTVNDVQLLGPINKLGQ